MNFLDLRKFNYVDFFSFLFLGWSSGVNVIKLFFFKDEEARKASVCQWQAVVSLRQYYKFIKVPRLFYLASLTSQV